VLGDGLDLEEAAYHIPAQPTLAQESPANRPLLMDVINGE